MLGSPLTVGVNTNNGWYAANRQYAAISGIQHEQLTHRVTSSLSANWVPMPWFTNRVTLGMDYAGDNINTYLPLNTFGWYGGLSDTGSQSEQYRDTERYTVDYLGNARKTFGAREPVESQLVGRPSGHCDEHRSAWRHGHRLHYQCQQRRWLGRHDNGLKVRTRSRSSMAT